nr:hypothetical protein Iba_chr11eCG6600 [Ipomoea batatas]
MTWPGDGRIRRRIAVLLAERGGSGGSFTERVRRRRTYEKSGHVQPERLVGGLLRGRSALDFATTGKRCLLFCSCGHGATCSMAKRRAPTLSVVWLFGDIWWYGEDLQISDGSELLFGIPWVAPVSVPLEELVFQDVLKRAQTKAHQILPVLNFLVSMAAPFPPTRSDLVLGRMMKFGLLSNEEKGDRGVDAGRVLCWQKRAVMDFLKRDKHGMSQPRRVACVSIAPQKWQRRIFIRGNEHSENGISLVLLPYNGIESGHANSSLDHIIRSSKLDDNPLGVFKASVNALILSVLPGKGFNLFGVCKCDVHDLHNRITVRLSRIEPCNAMEIQDMACCVASR